IALNGNHSRIGNRARARSSNRARVGATAHVLVELDLILPDTWVSSCGHSGAARQHSSRVHDSIEFFVAAIGDYVKGIILESAGRLIPRLEKEGIGVAGTCRNRADHRTGDCASAYIAGSGDIRTCREVA